MKKIKIKRLVFILCTILTFSFALMSVNFGVVSHAETDTKLEEQITTYQGENNWYIYSGDFSKQDLRYMLYSPVNAIWQGQEENCRLFPLSLIQFPSANCDSMRAKVVSKNGKMVIVGRVEHFSNESSGNSVTVGVMLAKNGDLNNVVTLVDYRVLSSETDNFYFDANEEGFEVASGDVIFFIAKATGEKSAGVIFDVDFNYSEIVSSSAPSNNVVAKNLVVGEGDAVLTYENNANAIRDKVGVIQNAMQVTNEGEHLSYVYQPSGLKKVYPMDFAGYNSPGWWFTMPNAQNSVGAVWQNKFYSNPNSGYGFAGLAYTAPASGTLSVIGATARSTEIELGDDGALLGEAEEYALWDLFLVTENEFKTIARDTIEPGNLKSIEGVSGTQNITVKKGDVVFLRYASSSPWKVSCITAGFNFVAQPIDSFEGWQVSADATEEEFLPLQGENETYHAYGDVNDKYWLLTPENEGYTGGSVYATTTVTAQKTIVTSAFETLRVYKAVGSGEAELKGNFMQKTFDTTNVTLAVYKRAYVNGGYGDAQLLFSDKTNQRKSFAEFSITENLSNGDILLVSLIKEGEKNSSQVVEGALNVKFSFNVVESGEPTEGIGEVVLKMKNDQYSTEQGKTGWFYAYGNYENYVLMSYGFGYVNYNNWFGPEWNNRIELGVFCPGAYSGSMMIYVAPADGTFKAEGKLGVLTTDCLPGVKAYVTKNGEVVNNNQFDYGDLTDRIFSIELEVKAGDLIIFHVENVEGDTVGYATEVGWNFEYDLITESSELLTIEERLNCLSDKKSYAEYIGIQDNYTKDDGGTIQDANAQSDKEKGCGGAVASTSVIIGALYTSLLLIKRRRAK